MTESITIEDQAARDNGILFAGTAVDVLVPATATQGAFTLLRFVNPSGSWTPLHLHHLEDETVYVLSGTMRAELPDGARDLVPGQALILPRGQPHRLGNVGDVEARFLVLCTPGGFDDFIRAAGRPGDTSDMQMTEADAARLVEAAPRHGIELPAPGGPGPMETRQVTTAGLPAVLDVGHTSSRATSAHLPPIRTAHLM